MGVRVRFGGVCARSFRSSFSAWAERIFSTILGSVLVFGGGGSFWTSGFVGGTIFCGAGFGGASVFTATFSFVSLGAASFTARFFAAFPFGSPLFADGGLVGLAADLAGALVAGFAAIGDLIWLVSFVLEATAFEAVVAFGALVLAFSATVDFFGDFKFFAGCTALGLFLVGFLASLFFAAGLSAEAFLGEAAGFLAGAGFFLEGGTGRLLKEGVRKEE